MFYEFEINTLKYKKIIYNLKNKNKLLVHMMLLIILLKLDKNMHNFEDIFISLNKKNLKNITAACIFDYNNVCITVELKAYFCLINNHFLT